MSLPRSYLAAPEVAAPGLSIRGTGYSRTLRFLSDHPVFDSPSLSIRGIGIRETMPPSLIERAAGTGDYLFMFFLDSAQFGPGPDGRPIGAGQLIFWDRGAAHFYGNPVKQWKHSWIHCDGRDVDSILCSLHVPRGQPVTVASPARTEKYLFDLHEELSGFAKPSQVILRNLLENLVRDAVRNESRPDRPSIPENLLRCREHIDTHYDERLTLTDLAASAGLSVPHFCTEFRRYFEVPPIAYLIRRRMRVAAALLRGTEAPVGEIGQKVGYDDPFYFSKHFKVFFGLSPTAVRKGR